MQRYVDALHTNASVQTSELNTLFLRTYACKLYNTHSDVEKCDQLLANFLETYNRLCGFETIDAESTYWKSDRELWFCPDMIDRAHISQEQWSSLQIMNKFETTHPITVNVDFKNITWYKAFRMSTAASFQQITDGLRLWSTLPHKIEKINIICPNSSARKIVETITMKVINEKIQDRIHFITK